MPADPDDDDAPLPAGIEAQTRRDLEGPEVLVSRQIGYDRISAFKVGHRPFRDLRRWRLVTPDFRQALTFAKAYQRCRSRADFVFPSILII
jgi:hypothetical protein